MTKQKSNEGWQNSLKTEILIPIRFFKVRCSTKLYLSLVIEKTTPYIAQL